MANIIITGANQGIGYYFTEQALKDGNKVAVLDVETDKLEALAQAFPKQLLCFRRYFISYYPSAINSDKIGFSSASTKRIYGRSTKGRIRNCKAYFFKAFYYMSQLQSKVSNSYLLFMPDQNGKTDVKNDCAICER